MSTECSGASPRTAASPPSAASTSKDHEPSWQDSASAQSTTAARSPAPSKAEQGESRPKARRPPAPRTHTANRIGRVTEGLLLRVSEHVDVVEPIAKFTAALQGKPGVRAISNVGLEEWQPPAGQEYDLVWAQWCLGHLTDEQLVRFLALCKTVLTPATGLIVVKENLSTSATDVFDSTDSSVTRYVAPREDMGKLALFYAPNTLPGWIAAFAESLRRRAWWLSGPSFREGCRSVRPKDYSLCECTPCGRETGLPRRK